MEQSQQKEFFWSGRQGDLFGPPPPVSYAPKPEKVRAELLKLLAQAQTAEVSPWSEKDFRYYRKVFPQMANWLPEDEAEQLRAAFAAEIARLEAA